jgi:hypothetical protein
MGQWHGGMSLFASISRTVGGSPVSSDFCVHAANCHIIALWLRCLQMHGVQPSVHCLGKVYVRLRAVVL